MSQRMIEMIVFFGALLFAVVATHAYLISRSEEQKLQSILLSQNAIISDANTRQQQRDTALASTLAGIAKQKNANQSPQELADALAKILALPQPIHLDSPLKSSSATKGAPSGPTSALASRNPNVFSKSSLNSPSLSNSTPNLDLPSTPSAGLPAPTNTGLAQPLAPSQALSAMQASPDGACSSAPKCLPDSQAAELPAADLKPLYDYALDCRACQVQLAVAKQNASDDAAKIAALTRERDAAVAASKGGTWLRRLRRNAIWFAAGAVTAYAASHR